MVIQAAHECSSRSTQPRYKPMAFLQAGVKKVEHEIRNEITKDLSEFDDTVEQILHQLIW